MSLRIAKCTPADDVVLIGLFNSGSPSEAFDREELMEAVSQALVQR